MRAIVLSLPALLMAQYQQVDATGYLCDKSLARLVATNRLSNHTRQSSTTTRFLDPAAIVVVFVAVVLGR